MMVTESNVRSSAKRCGYTVRKRTKTSAAIHGEGFMLLDGDGRIVAGRGFDASLDQIARHLAPVLKRRAAASATAHNAKVTAGVKKYWDRVRRGLAALEEQDA